MKSEVKIAAVYTGMPVSLVENVEREIFDALRGIKVTILTMSDPSVISDAIKNGRPGVRAVRNLVRMYIDGVMAGADVVYNICSSVGDIADLAMPLFSEMGVPLVRVDEEMARTAVRSADRIGILATLPSTLNPTKRLVGRLAGEAKKQIELVEILADGAFGAPAGEADRLLVEKSTAIADSVDCILLAQGSMAASGKKIAAAVKKPVFSSPAYGARALRKVIENM